MAAQNRRAHRRWTSAERNPVRIFLPDVTEIAGAKMDLVDLSEGGAMVRIIHPGQLENLCKAEVSGFLLDNLTHRRYDFTAEITWVKRLSGLPDLGAFGLSFRDSLRFDPRLISLMMAEGYLN